MNRLVLDHPNDKDVKFVIEPTNNGVFTIREHTITSSITNTIDDNTTQETITTIVTRTTGSGVIF